jgi:hypothetical protein
MTRQEGRQDNGNCWAEAIMAMEGFSGKIAFVI